MLHINIVGVVTCSDNSTRRLVMCSLSLDLFSIHFVSTLHCHFCDVSITIQEKQIKLNKMLSIIVMSCNFMSCIFMFCIFMHCVNPGVPSSGSRKGFPLSTTTASGSWLDAGSPPASQLSQICPRRRGGYPSGDPPAPPALSLRELGLEALNRPPSGGDAGRCLPAPGNTLWMTKANLRVY